MANKSIQYWKERIAETVMKEDIPRIFGTIDTYAKEFGPEVAIKYAKRIYQGQAQQKAMDELNKFNYFSKTAPGTINPIKVEKARQALKILKTANSELGEQYEKKFTEGVQQTNAYINRTTQSAEKIIPLVSKFSGYEKQITGQIAERVKELTPAQKAAIAAGVAGGAIGIGALLLKL